MATTASRQSDSDPVPAAGSQPGTGASTAASASPVPRIAPWQVAALLSLVLVSCLVVALKPGSTFMPAYSYYVMPDTILYDAKTKGRAAIILDVGPHTFPDGSQERGVRVRVVKGSDQWRAWGVTGETGWIRASLIQEHFLVRAADP